MLAKSYYLFLLALAPVALFSGCSAAHYRKSADKEVYGIIAKKDQVVFGKTNQFTINTPYSNRNPDDIKAPEILEDRLRGGHLKPTLSEALKMAVEDSRSFQLRK